MKTGKTAILFAAMILLSIISFSQNNYERGFKAGYANGFCFDITTACTVTIPDVKVKSGKFKDGYTVGFEKALKERKDINYKTYNKQYLNVTEDIKRQYPIVNDINAFTTAMEKANYYYLIGDYEKAIALSELLSRNMEDDYRPKMYKGLSLIELEDFKQGKKFVTWALRDVKDLEQKQKLENVIQELDNGTYKTNNKTNDPAIVAPSEKTLSATLPKEAKAKKNEVVKQNAEVSSTNNFYTSAMKKYTKKDYAGAVYDFTKSIDEKATQQAYYYRALAKEKLGDTYGAANDFAYLVQASADNSINYADVHLRYGTILLKQKKYEQVITEMDALIKLNDKDKLPQAFYNRGIAKAGSGNKDGGCGDLSKAGELGYKEAYEAIKEFCN